MLQRGIYAILMFVCLFVCSFVCPQHVAYWPDWPSCAIVLAAAALLGQWRRRLTVSATRASYVTDAIAYIR